MKVVILAGGSGTRLWPLSRGRYPKQFVKLNEGGTSLFQHAFRRSLLVADIADVYVVTNEKHKYLVIDAIAELGYALAEGNIIAEPEAKNTLPAIYAGMLAASKDGECTVAVYPSDHLIAKDAEFASCVQLSASLAVDHLVTFGIRPTHPHTGYGYIAPGPALSNGFRVNEFKEKPDSTLAISYIDKGYLWNSGMFLLHSKKFIAEVQAHAPEIAEAFHGASSIAEAFSRIKNKVSIDYGLLEKSSSVAVVPCDIGWSDLGSFDSLYDVSVKDEQDNVAGTNTLMLSSSKNIIRSDSGRLIATIGIENMIVMDTRDALLLCHRGQAEQVKSAVAALQDRCDNRTEYHATDYRPWGHYTVLEERKNTYKIKRIVVNPGKRLSYQMHYHRSEHWVVVKGTARVTLDGEEKLVSAGESIFIKACQKHRLENSGKLPLEIIEVQMGEYLEEDDIVRLGDEYGRA